MRLQFGAAGRAGLAESALVRNGHPPAHVPRPSQQRRRCHLSNGCYFFFFLPLKSLTAFLVSLTRNTASPLLELGLVARYAYSMLILPLARVWAIPASVPGRFAFSMSSTLFSMTRTPRSPRRSDAFKGSLTTIRTTE